MATRQKGRALEACCSIDEIYRAPKVTKAARTAARATKTAGAPPVTFTAHPVVSGKLAYLALAPVKEGGTQQVKIVTAFRMTNTSDETVTLTGVKYSFPGSNKAAITSEYVSREIKAGESQWWSNGVVEYEEGKSVNNAIYMDAPAPAKIKVELTFSGYTLPLVYEASLTPYSCTVTGGAWLFPFSAADLRPGEFFTATARHWANGGGAGRQIYAHDIGLTGYDEKAKKWSGLLPGGDSKKNEDHRIWAKPVRAVAAGTVEDWHDGMATNVITGKMPDPTPDPVGGNHIWIRHANELVVYTHLIKDSIPAALKQKGAAVAAGQMVGRAGNSGNSSGPHEHFESKSTDQFQPLRPLPLKDCWVVSQDLVTPGTAKGPWVRLSKQGIPKDTVLVWPAATKPAWYPPGWAEVAHHGIPEASYQFIFDRAADAGYRPAFINGYVAGGKTYFNVIFRPVGKTAWVARHGMTGAGYQKEFDTHAGNGYRLENVCAYLSDGKVRYAAVWSKASGPGWIASHGLNALAFATTHADWMKKGYRPTNISVIAPGDKPQYTLLYEKRATGTLAVENHILASAYQAAWDKHTKAGLQLAYLSACNATGGPRITAIFQAKAPGSGGTVGRHNLSSSPYQTNYEEWLGKGLLTRTIAGYGRGGTHNFAAAWRKP